MEQNKYSITSLLENYRVVIPIIQRDYVQGVKDERIDRVLTQFLENICSKKIETLDFIYGYTELGEFIPIDGQQRLTTLFLLAIYDKIKNKTNEINFNNFTYKIRHTTEEFLKTLLENATDLNFDNAAPKEAITSQSWFSLLWLEDPTVEAMLNALDKIHQICKDKPSLKEIYNSITFLLLDLNTNNYSFDTPEDIFIKMNSRGLQLTPFQHFKAWLEEIWQNSNNKSKNLDTEWLETFWEIANNLNKGAQSKNLPEITESLLLKFINEFVLFYALLKSQDKDKVPLDYLTQKTNKDNFFFNRQEYEKVKDYLQTDSLVWEVIAHFTENRNKITVLINNFIGEPEKPQSVDKHFLGYIQDIFQNYDFQNLTYKTRVYLWAVLLWFTGVDNESFGSFFRIIVNLTENTNINAENIHNIAKAIDTLVNKNIVEEDVKGFDNEQIKEERIKEKLIKSNSEWATALQKAERHWYLSGQVGFLLKLACTKDNDNYTWDSFINDMDNFSANDFDILRFRNYTEIFISAFDLEKELENDTIPASEKYIMRRTLLAYGDYLPWLGGSKYTLCSFKTDLDTKNREWRKVFKGISGWGNYNHNNILKQLLQDLLNHSKKIDKSLIDSSDIKDWRRIFINFPELFEITEFKGNFQVYDFSNNQVYIVLGTGTKKNDIYTRALNILYENRKVIDCTPFDHCFYYPHISQHCFVFENWKGISIDVRFKRAEKPYFELRLFYRPNNHFTNVSENTLSSLKEKGYEFSKAEEYGYTFKVRDIEPYNIENLQNIIEDILKILNEL